MLELKKKLQNIKAFAFDVDGVFSREMLILTDGGLVRQMNPKDGYAVQYALKKQFPVAIITGAACESIRQRFGMLGITDIYQRSADKLADLEDFRLRYGLRPEEVLYMGDDLPDYPVMQAAGVSACPRDAAEEIRAVADYVSGRDGGAGCVRDVIEQTLKLQGRWMDADAISW